MRPFCWYIRNPLAPPRPAPGVVPYPGQLFGLQRGESPWPMQEPATHKVLDVRSGWVLVEQLGAKVVVETAYPLDVFNRMFKRKPNMNQRLRDYIERAVADWQKITTDISFKSIESAFATVDGFRTWLDEKYPDIPTGTVVVDDATQMVTIGAGAR